MNPEIKDIELFRAGSAYVLNNKLEKWRYNSDDKESLDYKLAKKCENGTELALSDYLYMFSKGELVIQEGRHVHLYNFSEHHLERLNKKGHTEYKNAFEIDANPYKQLELESPEAQEALRILAVEDNPQNTVTSVIDMLKKEGLE